MGVMEFTLRITMAYYSLAAMFIGMVVSVIGIVSAPDAYRSHPSGAIYAIGMFIVGLATGYTLAKWLGAA